MKYLIGAGGHATVLCDIAEEQNIRLDGVFISPNAKNITELPVIDDIINIEKYPNDEFILAFGNIKARMKLQKELEGKIKWFSLIDKSARISKHASIGVGVVIMPNVVINSGVYIGDHSIINTAAIVEHQTTIEKHVHVSPKGTICGNCTIGEGSWIGAGATVRDGIKVGKSSIIGLGAAVIDDIPDKVTAVGVPAKVKKMRGTK